MYYVSNRLNNRTYRVVNTVDWSVSYKGKDEIFKDIKSSKPYFGINFGKKIAVDGEIPVIFASDVLDYFYAKKRLTGDSHIESDTSSKDCEWRCVPIEVNGIGFVIQYMYYLTEPDVKVGEALGTDLPIANTYADYPIYLHDVYYISEPKDQILRVPDLITEFNNHLRGGFVDLDESVERRDITLVLPEKLEVLQPSTFYRCSFIKKLILGSHLSVIPRFCFSHCNNLVSVEFRQDFFGRDFAVECRSKVKLLQIEEYAFNNCRITELSIPYSVTSLGTGAFAECKNLKEIWINCVEVIGESAFQNCISLTSVDFTPVVRANWQPIDLQFIGENAFHDCINLHRVSIQTDLSVAVQKDIFYGCSALETVYLTSDAHQGELEKELKRLGYSDSVLYCQDNTPF